MGRVRTASAGRSIWPRRSAASRPNKRPTRQCVELCIFKPWTNCFGNRRVGFQVPSPDWGPGSHGCVRKLCLHTICRNSDDAARSLRNRISRCVSASGRRCCYSCGWQRVWREWAMSHRWSIWVTCPACGTPGQSFGVFASLKRRCTLSCRECARPLVSDLTRGTYALLAIYSSLLATVVGVPLVLALVARAWIAVTAMVLLLVLCLVPPYLVAHARRTSVLESADTSHD